jgi:kynureninase
MENYFEYAIQLDEADELKEFRHEFHIPKDKTGKESIYFCGNSLGLMPKTARAYIQQELDDWQELGVDGHTRAQHPWVKYHEFLTDPMAAVVGGLLHEVVVMNSLTVNLHLMMVSFYRPDSTRFKILMDYSPFPSDRYALESQVKFHGFDPASAIIELSPDPGTEYVSEASILNTIQQYGDSIALIMIGGVNYYTGQAYNIRAITAAGHEKGCLVGFDLAHAAGNLKLSLHEDGPDFAVWCSYKYLNSGPGSLSGCFVHERHYQDFGLPRFTGWWGHDKNSRFKMGKEFSPMAGAEGWQLSNPPVFPMAAMKASLDIFDRAGMYKIRAKSEKLTAYLEYLIRLNASDKVNIITPADPLQRGAQLSLQVSDKKLHQALTDHGVIADWREPDVIRVAPAPLYNSFKEVWQFVRILENCDLK